MKKSALEIVDVATGEILELNDFAINKYIADIHKHCTDDGLDYVLKITEPGVTICYEYRNDNDELCSDEEFFEWDIDMQDEGLIDVVDRYYEEGTSLHATALNYNFVDQRVNLTTIGQRITVDRWLVPRFRRVNDIVKDLRFNDNRNYFFGVQDEWPETKIFKSIMEILDMKEYTDLIKSEYTTVMLPETNVGAIRVPIEDVELARKVDKLATQMYEISNELSGAEYFTEIAKVAKLEWHTLL